MTIRLRYTATLPEEKTQTVTIEFRETSDLMAAIEAALWAAAEAAKESDAMQGFATDLASLMAGIDETMAQGGAFAEVAGEIGAMAEELLGAVDGLEDHLNAALPGLKPLTGGGIGDYADGASVVVSSIGSLVGDLIFSGGWYDDVDHEHDPVSKGRYNIQTDPEGDSEIVVDPKSDRDYEVVLEPEIQPADPQPEPETEPVEDEETRDMREAEERRAEDPVSGRSYFEVEEGEGVAYTDPESGNSYMISEEEAEHWKSIDELDKQLAGDDGFGDDDFDDDDDSSSDNDETNLPKDPNMDDSGVAPEDLEKPDPTEGTTQPGITPDEEGSGDPTDADPGLAPWILTDPDAQVIVFLEIPDHLGPLTQPDPTGVDEGTPPLPTPDPGTTYIVEEPVPVDFNDTDSFLF